MSAKRRKMSWRSPSLKSRLIGGPVYFFALVAGPISWAASGPELMGAIWGSGSRGMGITGAGAGAGMSCGAGAGAGSGERMEARAAGARAVPSPKTICTPSARSTIW